MKVFDQISQYQAWRSEQTQDIGFVPTMGALHDGHMSLVKQSQKDCAQTVVSIFVNPTQFNNAEDLAGYPNKQKEDLALLQTQNVDAVLLPTQEQLYPNGYPLKIAENDFSTHLEGAHRPGHFDGMLTIVCKLFNIVRPTRAYFGTKDFQQLKLVERMVDELFLPVKVVACETVRESDGLAMSSRNLNLSDEQRSIAPELYKAISEAPTNLEAKQRLESQGFEVDYIEEWMDRRLAAAHLGTVRLIDNVKKPSS